MASLEILGIARIPTVFSEAANAKVGFELAFFSNCDTKP